METDGHPDGARDQHEVREHDVLIIGAGGAGLRAAIEATERGLSVGVVTKSLLGKAHTVMAEGGMAASVGNVDPDDNWQTHFMDTMKSGKFLNNWRMAEIFAKEAPDRVYELEQWGALFNRTAEGKISQRPFGGHTYRRLCHVGDRTGLEMIRTLQEKVLATNTKVYMETTVTKLFKNDGRVVGALAYTRESGKFIHFKTRAVVMATGGWGRIYKVTSNSWESNGDGAILAYDAGAELVDMEMVQFHPTGLLAGPDTRMTGTVLEEGLRGSGGYLIDGTGERFMFEYDPRGERATRDIVSRSIMDRIRKGHATPNGGVWIQMSHLGPAEVRKKFKGMVERCADCGFDLAGGRVEVIPTAHYMMGGVVFDRDCSTPMPRLYAAGEDTGGVHGANRLGGNGVANSTVFGGLAGDAMGSHVRWAGSLADPDRAAVEASLHRAFGPLGRRGGDIEGVRRALHDLMWEDVGILRTAEGLARGAAALESLAGEIAAAGVADPEPRFNLTWMDRLNLENLVLVSRAICAAAEARHDSRGAHFREDHPETSDLETSRYTVVRLQGEDISVGTEPVRFTRVRPGESLLREAAE